MNCCVYEEFFKDLFDFYEKKVLSDLEAEVELIESKREVRELNNKLGLFERLVLEKLIITSKTEKFTKINEDLKNIRGIETIIIKTSLPELAMATLLHNLQTHEKDDLDSSKNIFVSIHQLCKHENDLLKAATSKSFKLNSTLNILDNEDSDISCYSEIFHKFAAEVKTIFFTKRTWEYLKTHFSFTQQKSITLQWSDLTNERKNMLLKTNLSFQGKKIKLKKIWSKKSNILQNMPIEDFEYLSSIEIQGPQHLANQTSYYIQRKFRHYFETHQHNVLNAKDVIKMMKIEKSVILGDAAGMGKTTSAFRIANLIKKSKPKFWVAFVDLKEHTKFYISNTQEQTSEIDVKYLSENLLALKHNFDQTLFQELFEKSKVYFVIDGYDEISPKFNNFILNLLRFIHDSGNFMLVTTRLHLVTDLENKLEKSAIRLEPFDKTDQINFLINFWKKKNLKTTKNLKIQAKNLLRIFENKLNHQDFVEIPLQLFMMAEVYENLSNSEDILFNLYLLYENFVSKKIDIWDKKGPLVRIESREIQKGLVNVCQMHQNFAIVSYFGEDVAERLGIAVADVELNETNELKEMVIRIGLIKKALHNSFEFIHKTYSEYFIAEYCYKKYFLGLAAKAEVDFFKEIYFENDHHEGIRKFINEKLRATNSAVFSKIWKNAKRNFCDKDQRALLYYDCKGVLAYFLANEADFEMVLNNIQSSLDREAFHSYLLANDWLVDVLCYFTFCAKREQFLKLWEFVDRNFEKEVKTFLLLQKFLGNRNALVTSCVNKHTATMHEVFVIARSLLEKDKFLRELTKLDSFGFQAFHYSFLYGNAASYLAAYEQEFEAKLEEDAIRKLLIMKFPHGRNILHFVACNSSQDTWSFVLNHLEKWILRGLLLEKDLFGHNVFEKAAFHNKKIIITLLDWFKSNSEAGELEVIFKKRNNENHFTLLHFISWFCDESLTEKVFLFLFNCKFAEELIKTILLSKDRDGDTPLYSAVFNKHRSTVRVFYHFYLKTLGVDEVNKILSDMDFYLSTDSMKRKDALDFLKSLC